MNFAERIKTYHFMTLEGLARKIGVSHGVLRGIAAGTHKSQPVVDKLIAGGYINSADDLPAQKNTSKSLRKITIMGIRYNSNIFASAELFELANIGDVVSVRETENSKTILQVYKDDVYLCDIEIVRPSIKSKAEVDAQRQGLTHVRGFELDFSYKEMAKRG